MIWNGSKSTILVVSQTKELGIHSRKSYRNDTTLFVLSVIKTRFDMKTGI